ncbi:MAG TPA: CAP domain-containing protein [Acidimicrobiia bacterium]|nr:CAP domain-containing protein [Acidimicrobiia bacterium]
MRRGVKYFAVALVLLVALPARADDLGAAVNSVRSPDLAIDGTVDGFAQAAANRIAGGQSLIHSNLGPLLGTCSAAGEVIGYGSDVSAVMNAFANSPSHWTLIQQSKWNAMGTGAATDSAGRLWVAIVFCTLPTQSVAPPPPPPTTVPPPPPTTAPPPPPTTAPPPPPTTTPQPVVTQPVVTTTTAPPPPPPVPLAVFRVGPILSVGGTISLFLGASPFLPPEDWQTFDFPTVS